MAPVLGASRRVGGNAGGNRTERGDSSAQSRVGGGPSLLSVACKLCRAGRLGSSSERSCTRTGAPRASQTADSRQLDVPVVARRFDLGGG